MLTSGRNVNGKWDLYSKSMGTIKVAALMRVATECLLCAWHSTGRLVHAIPLALTPCKVGTVTSFTGKEAEIPRT